MQALALCSNILLRDKAIGLPVDFKSRAGTPSGPVALFPFSLLILYSISFCLIVKFLDVGGSVSRLQTCIGWLSPAGPIRFVAMVQKYLFSRFAFSVSSAVSVPSSFFN